MMKNKVRVICIGFISIILLSGCSNPEERKAIHYQKGLKYSASGNNNAAIIEFRNAIQIDPRFSDARYQLGLAYLKSEQPARAFEQLERAASLDPNNIDAMMKTAELYFLNKNFTESRKQALKALAADKSFSDAHALLALIEIEENRLADAETAISHALKIEKKAKYYVILSRIMNATDRLENAEKTLAMAVEIEPKPVYINALANFYTKRGKDSEAEKLLKSMLANQTNASENYLNLAIFYMKRGQTAEAEKQILAAIEKDTDSPELYTFLGNFYREIHDYEKAETAYRKAVHKSQNPDDVKVLLADLYLKTGRLDLACRTVQPILENAPKHPTANLVRAKALIREQKNTEALAVLKDLGRAFPHWGDVYYLKGRALFNRGEIELSFDAINQALEYAPSHTAARILLARHLLLKKEYRTAREEALKALKLDSHSIEAAVILGKSLTALGEAEKAVKLFEDLEQYAPENIEILYGKSAACLAQNNIADALEGLNRILAIEPDFSPALLSMCKIMIAEDKFDQAIERVRKHLQKSPDKPEQMLLLADLLERYGSSENEALKLLEQVRDISPETPGVFIRIANLLLRMGRTEKAIQQCRTLVKLYPNDVDGQMALGTLLEQTGDSAGAKAAYTRALELRPGLAAAANNLAWLVANQPEPDLDEALRMALIAKEKLPEDPYIADTLGWIHYKRGAYKLALTQFRMAIEKKPDFATLRYHMALALLATGQKDSARKELDRCISTEADFPEFAEAERLLKKIDL